MVVTNPEPQQIKSKVIKTELVRWKDLKFIQQEDFKEWIDSGDEKLIQSLLRYNFIDPFKVWFDGTDTWCLDGFHRCKDLITLEEMGCEVPDKLPATFIDCEDKQDAAELVLVYSSQYAKLTRQGLYDFLQTYDIDLPAVQEAINIPEFSMDRFEQQFDIFNTEEHEEPLVEITEEEDLIVKPGDLFEINGHRIICGSFKDSETVDKLMDGQKARIVNCDPPYNLPASFFLKDNKKVNNHKDFAEGAGEMTDEQFAEFLQMIMERSVENTVPGAIHYIFMDWRHSWHMTEAGRKVYGSPIPKQICVWNKDMMANGSFYRAQQELCFIFNDQRAKALWKRDIVDMGGFYKDNDELVFIFKNGGDNVKHLSHLALKDRIRSNVWNYPSAISTANPDRYELKNHPTPKPVVMIADAILDTTNRGDLVIDWFLGSGTALIACEATKRFCRATEIEPKYVQGDLIRYLNYCDKKGIDVNFTHLNGTLTLNNLRDAQSKNQNNGGNKA